MRRLMSTCLATPTLVLAAILLLAATAAPDVTVVHHEGTAASAATTTASPLKNVAQGPSQVFEGDYLYKTLMVRAAPGSLLTLIDMLEERMPVYASTVDAGPFWMRHTQGDQWDLLILFPMESFEDYYGPEARERRDRAYRSSGTSEEDFQRAAAEHISWQEELFVWGPPVEVVAGRFEGQGFYHIEIFQVLPGKREALLEQRRMENDYLGRIGRQQNLIFRRAGGAAWDSYTLGFYRDLKQYAESADIPAEVQEEAALAAGFEGADKIGSYMRTLILFHRDTLAVAIR